MFKNINKIESTNDKKFFIEKVNLYIKLINVFAQRNNLIDASVDSEISNDTIKRLKELKIIESNSEDEQRKLMKFLKAPNYKEFIKAINYNLKYQKLIGDLLDNLDPSKRKIIQEKSNKKIGPRTVDFFCGAGGLSLGFSQDGFQIDLANDYDDVCVETFKYNHPEVPDKRVILGDIRNIVDHIDDYIENEIDVVIGGPPCQGFSSANQQRIIDDPRNELYKYYLKAISKIAPKFVVMENVKGMLPYAEQVVQDYNSIRAIKGNNTFSYSVDFKVFVSSDFGVAQKRQRLIFIAVRNDISEKRKISPLDIFQEIENTYSQNKEHVLGDALEYIKPLDAPRIKNMTEVDDEITGKIVAVNQFNGTENSYLSLINEGRKIEYVFNHKARYINDINYEIYGTLEQGEDGTSERIKHVMPYKHRNHIFKDKYFKLIENKPSRTITAHLKMDCHSHIHPRQVRSITPREAARIQSFPDDYLFLGAYLKTYMQIGNAVPPLMARGIARAIKKYI
jgi:DNA (cytosine-5)-methyltransferase 1